MINRSPVIGNCSEKFPRGAERKTFPRSEYYFNYYSLEFDSARNWISRGGKKTVAAEDESNSKPTLRANAAENKHTYMQMSYRSAVANYRRATSYKSRHSYVCRRSNLLVGLNTEATGVQFPVSGAQCSTFQGIW